jgi:hypothetical protein
VRDAINTPTDDPLLAVSAMAAATQRVGFAVTVCSTYERPYAFTRKMTTLAHIRASQRGGTGAVEDRALPAWVSVTHRAVAAIAYEVESVDAETRVVIRRGHADTADPLHLGFGDDSLVGVPLSHLRG